LPFQKIIEGNQDAIDFTMGCKENINYLLSRSPTLEDIAIPPDNM
jgi:hypothetical protein